MGHSVGTAQKHIFSTLAKIDMAKKLFVIILPSAGGRFLAISRYLTKAVVLKKAFSKICGDFAALMHFLL